MTLYLFQQQKENMKNLNQQQPIFYRNELISFIDFDSQRNGYIQIFIGMALLFVNIDELSN